MSDDTDTDRAGHDNGRAPVFEKLVFTPTGLGDAGLAIAACRAGGVGVLNGELALDQQAVRGGLEALAVRTNGGYGLKLDALGGAVAEDLVSFAARGLRWLILDADHVPESAEAVATLRQRGVRVLAEVRAPVWPSQSLDGIVDGLVIKGNEAGGLVGEESSFILLQRWLRQTALPLYLRGGVTPQVAAACSAIGVAGGVLDSQVLLLEESVLADSLATLLRGLAGNETVAVGNGERGEYFRLLVRPGYQAAGEFVTRGECRTASGLYELAVGAIHWAPGRDALMPLGQDVGFAGAWRERYGRIAQLFSAIDAAVEDSLRVAAEQQPLAAGSPLAAALGVRYPLVQGPMTRVSDRAEFALAVAEGGGLPVVAFALMKGQALSDVLAETTRMLQGRPWGIGLLGFAPQALLDGQLAIAKRFKPSYAIIAGGRPDQAVHLDAAGIPTFLHVPSANLIALFLQEGARRFIFEGRECGGHIGPLSSFVLWSATVDRLVAEIDAGKAPAEEIQALFAGGVHDAVSAAAVQALIAPLVERGVKVGVLMGSAYLFTREIVATGALVPQFQSEVVECERTVNLESGPGHASRCAYTPFAAEFFRAREQLRSTGLPADETRSQLDDLILGRLRIAAKGQVRVGPQASLQQIDAQGQRREGMYMLGQVATLRHEVTDIASLHHEVSAGSAALLAARRAKRAPPAEISTAVAADIAIVGIASVFPKAGSTREFWENVLTKVDGITEIPAHRWDWRLYFDEDRNAPDRIYSRWGGFLDDLAFDPTRYGMPPKSIASVDPMQLMALEVAQRTLVDAGYDRRTFDRERASVIIGASGGTGDVGMQFGLRAELPRFQGHLPPEVAARLPTWTEDSFAGILLNVIAGRIANRLNFGGVNFTTDAACASSLAAIYQGVSELTARRSDFVIAGGVDTVQGPFGYLCFSKTQALSPRGRCSTFDAAGDGIVISEGIAMVALKRLADAERDGDRIYAVIKGAGGSSDGNAKGLTAPLPAGQLRAMRRAYRQAGFGPDTIAYFEAHGTGTVAGDTAELESTTALVRGAGGRAHQAAIGSVKTMIGHTKSSAGVAGLINATLALHHRVLPPHRNVTQPNAVLARPDASLYLVDEARPWVSAPEAPRRAAVSAFGFGGTNFHVVLEEYTREYRPWLRPVARQRWSAELLLWSGSDREALAVAIDATRAALQDVRDVELRDLAASLAAQWRPDAPTLAIVATDAGDFRRKADAALAWLRGAAERLPPGIHHGDGARGDSRLAFVFPGQGSQYPGMLRELAVQFPEIREALDEAEGLLQGRLRDPQGGDARLSHFIYPRGCYTDEEREAAARALTATDVAQPALGAVESGLLRLVSALGVQPDMMAGHSYGEFVALHAGGSLDYGALLALSAGRGRCIVDAAQAAGTELGTMAAVQATRADVEAALTPDDGVIVANHNAPLQSIIAGGRDSIRTVVARLVAAGLQATEIPVAAAFHSQYVRPAQAQLAALIGSTAMRSPGMPVYSNTTAAPHSTDVATMKEQLAEHLVSPVEFVAQTEAMYRDGARIFLEIGPKSVLTRLVGRILDGRPHRAIAIDDGTGIAGLLNALAQLVCAGIRCDVQRLFEGRDCRCGDPLRPDSLRRAVEVPKHAWLLNGSGARRASEPVRQIGVTIEQLASGPPAVNEVSPRPVQAPPQPPPAASVVASAGAASTGSLTKNRREQQAMLERLTGPPAGDSAVMAEYFATMRQFLETQERVMAMFMGDAVAASRSLPAPRRHATSLAAPPKAAAPQLPAPVPPPASEPAAASRGNGAAGPAARAKGNGADGPISPAPEKPASATGHGPNGATPSANGTAHNGASSAALTGLDRPAMTDLLLSIVEDKTGYPRDMVGLDQNLEADLGIDSIKRIEVVGAMLQKLPEGFRTALGEDRSKLNREPTLNGMLNMLSGLKVGGSVAGPFDLAGKRAEAEVVASHSSRHLIEPHAEEIDAAFPRDMQRGHFLVTEDLLGVADELIGRLVERGNTASLVGRDVLGDEDKLADWIARNRSDGRAVAGLLHLAPIGTPGLDVAEADAVQWREQLLINEKSGFMLAQAFSEQLTDGAHVLSASGLGGCFARQGTLPEGITLQGGAPGMLKSLQEERPGLRVKAVDTDPAQAPRQIAAALLAELELPGGRLEVGYPAGVRTIFRTVTAPGPGTVVASLSGLVVLATGGARGVTAETLRELALPGNTLVLVGRKPEPGPEPDSLQVLATAEALRRHFIDAVRAGASRMKPAEIGRKVQAVLAARELRANISDFRARGAVVEYHAADVTRDDDMKSLLALIESRHGRLDGIVHGAGIIEDRLLADKQPDSWSRVFDTKVMGLLVLLRHVRPEALKFLVVFSSVAGRYGNSGQSDYAAANEVMNRLCCQLGRRWNGRVKVKALCWGPWGPTRFGAGMVSAETEQKFADKGVQLVSAEAGRALFRGELCGGDPTVEIICGDGPWEQREAANGAIRAAPRTATRVVTGALLGEATVHSLPKGEHVVTVTLDANHAYLRQHLLDDVPILPAAAALELMAEAVAGLWPGWHVVAIRGAQLLKGIEAREWGRRLVAVIHPPPCDSSEGFEVAVRLRSDASPGREVDHYRAVLRLEAQYPETFSSVARPQAETQLTAARAYEQYLFHGPCYQVIETIEGLSSTGARARVRTTRPSDWLDHPVAGRDRWLFDPALLDAAAQMAIVWARSFRDETALPASFGRVVRFSDVLPDHLVMDFDCSGNDDPGVLRANVRFLNDDGKVVLQVEEMSGVCSSALNRLSGTSRIAAQVSV